MDIDLELNHRVGMMVAARPPLVDTELLGRISFKVANIGFFDVI